VTSCALAADPATNGSSALLAALIPFVAAIALLLISPLLTEKVKAVVRVQIAEEAGKLNVPEHKVPPI
jgi:hypothetical protein